MKPEGVGLVGEVVSGGGGGAPCVRSLLAASSTGRHLIIIQNPRRAYQSICPGVQESGERRRRCRHSAAPAAVAVAGEASPRSAITFTVLVYRGRKDSVEYDKVASTSRRRFDSRSRSAPPLPGGTVDVHA